MIRKQLAGLGHAKSLAQDRIPHEYIEMKAAESKYTDALKNERELVRSVLARQGFKPGVLLTRQESAAISAPTLMIYGSDDPVGSEDLWSEFTASMPNATLLVVPDSGHLPWFDRPDDVSARALEHLQTPSATS
jgi:pimeloyl-ACP methyl ester carboxylesterase